MTRQNKYYPKAAYKSHAWGRREGDGVCVYVLKSLFEKLPLRKLCRHVMRFSNDI
jgi:hypothetical protein